MTVVRVLGTEVAVWAIKERGKPESRAGISHRVRKAAEQGRQAMDFIKKRSNGTCDLDVVIVGCGPAGLSAGLAVVWQ